jgi:hypothetical protein
MGISRLVVSDPAAWRRRAVLALLAALAGVSALVAARRCAGALDRELDPPALLATALGATFLAAAARWLWLQHEHAEPQAAASSLRGVVGWSGSLALLLLAVGCCYPGNRNLEWLIWLPLIVCDQFWRQTFFDGGEPGQTFAGERRAAAEEVEAAESGFARARATCEGAPTDGADGETIVQQLFRVRDPQGGEAVYGAVQAEFAAGQRTTTLYVGFCPPLGAAPQVVAVAPGCPEVQVKVVQALAHGARLDVRLPEPAEEACRIPIDLAASPPAAASDSRCDGTAP